MAVPADLLERTHGPGAILGPVFTPRRAPGDPDVEIRVVGLGNGPERLGAEPVSYVGSVFGELAGSGCNLSPDIATRTAIVEALERYASCTVAPEHLLWSTALELEALAMPLDGVPRCSPSELDDARTWMRPADPAAPIRWAPGVRLSDGRPTWLPAVMVYVGLAPETDAECFWNPISTGCAAHRTHEQALVHGLLECIERDSLAITWLAEVPWPRVVLDHEIYEHVELPAIVDRFARSDLDVELYDATTDLGVPVVYGVLRSPHDPVVATMVGAGCGLDPLDALGRAMLEGVQGRSAVRASSAVEAPMPEDIAEFHDVMHGARHMGRPEQSSAFSFLGGWGEEPASDFAAKAIRTERPLAELVERLSARGIEAYAADLTTREVREAGLVAVRVVVPALQPLSFVHRARYLDHPRLRQVCAALGHEPRPGWNPLPQPFA